MQFIPLLFDLLLFFYDLFNQIWFSNIHGDLSFNKVSVNSFDFEQFPMRSLLNNLPLFNNKDFITVLNGTKSMSDQDDCDFLGFDQILNCSLNLILTLSI